MRTFSIGRLAYPNLAPNLGHGHTVFGLLQNERLSRVSVNFDAFMRFRSSPSQERLAENSNFKRSSFQQAEQLSSSSLCLAVHRDGIAFANDSVA